jgi:lipid A 4'-phosphatase
VETADAWLALRQLVTAADPVPLTKPFGRPARRRFEGQADLVTAQTQATAGQDARTTAVFGLWADPVLVLALSALWIALAIVFNGEPEIDRTISAFFYAAQACPEGSAATVCGGFPAAASAFWGALRNVFHYLPIVAALVVVAALASEIAAGRGFDRPRTRFAATALSALVIGPGLLVNGILKEYWGRPRPASTDLFGGQHPFVPAGQWSDECLRNCSFVSGEASSIFWLVCLIPLLPEHHRRIGAPAIIAMAVFASGLRIAFGGHYLSDVVLGGLSTIIVFAALATLVEAVARTVDAEEHDPEEQ